MTLSRRSVLRAGAGALAAGAAAGCLSAPADGDAPDGGYAAFFALYDWSRRVSGDAMTFENPVPAGTIGHGWEPPGDLQRDIADSAAFVYLDSPEFPWAQDVASDLETDYDHVTLIDGMDGIEEHLLATDREVGHDGGDGHDHGNGHEDHDDHQDHEGGDGHDHEGDHEHDHDHESEDDHDELSYDPHVWVDPVVAVDVVGTIADGLAEADPDNAERYEENAADYVERLEAVDERLGELGDEATRAVAVFAGHNSFRYLEDRYGFDLRTPTGISPNEAETSEDVAALIEVVEEHDIETILYDPFEATGGDDVPSTVDVLLEETDATDAEPLAALGGTTEEWTENGWGWVEQMEEINVPSLRKALDAA